MKIIRNNQELIVVLDNGEVLQSNNCDDYMFELVQTAESDDEIRQLVMPCYQKYKQEEQKIDQVMKLIDQSKELTCNGNSVYWPSVSELSVPLDFVSKVLEAEQSHNEDALQGYKNFWTLLSMNPDSRCRANLFWYLNHWGMHISKSGLFIGYRNVDIYRSGDNYYYSQPFCDYVVREYTKIREMHKATGDYYVTLVKGPATNHEVGHYEETGKMIKGTEWVECDLEEDDPDYFEPYENEWEEPEVVYVVDGEYKPGEDEHYGIVKVDTEEYNKLVDDNQVIMYNLKDLYNAFKAVNFDANDMGDDTIYTDHHTGTFRIQIGHRVEMPRWETDSNQNNQCSRGLHLANSEWLVSGYYGEQGLVCLCNPSDVVAVPLDSTYGKLRCCAYLPIARTKYDRQGKVIPYNVEDGFDSDWVKEIVYEGITSTELTPEYVIVKPTLPEVNTTTITENILNVAREFIKKKK